MIGSKIKNIREKCNLSIDYMAIQLEISKKDYIKIEKNANDLKISKLDKIVTVLGIRKSELFS